MQQDLSGISFNRHHKREAAARDAAAGLRWIIVGFLLGLASLFPSLVLLLMADHAPGLLASGLGLGLMVLAVAAFACGAYGVYLMMDALGWSGLVTAVVICLLAVPYVKLLVMIVIAVLASNQIRDAGYRFSMTGPLKRLGPPPLPQGED